MFTAQFFNFNIFNVQNIDFKYITNITEHEGAVSIKNPKQSIKLDL